MSRGALVLALGLFGVCFTAAAQQTKHSGAAQHRVTALALTPLDSVSSLSLYGPKALSASNNSLLFHNGPVRAWSDGAQLASETALAQIGSGAAWPLSGRVFSSERCRSGADEETKRRFKFSI